MRNEYNEGAGPRTAHTHQHTHILEPQDKADAVRSKHSTGGHLRGNQHNLQGAPVHQHTHMLSLTYLPVDEELRKYCDG